MHLQVPGIENGIEKLQQKGLQLEYRHIIVSENIHLRIFRAKYTTNLRILNIFDNPKPHIGFNFCISGATSFALSGGYPTAYAYSNKVNNFMMPTCTVTQALVLEPELSLVTCYIDTQAFVKLLGESIETLPITLLDCIEKGKKCYFECYQWQAIIQSILSQVFHAQMSPIAQKIFLESKVLELVAIILDIYEKGNQTQFTVSKKDIEKVQYAKELLLKDIANPPSLSQLARSAGTNEYTLKKGFRELFNKPVFKYLQEMRLSKAYELFQSTNLQVGDVSSIVGYESVSSFTRAFYQFYGVRPGDVKRIPFKTI
jgi:AraC-like DNA-binding protein